MCMCTNTSVSLCLQILQFVPASCKTFLDGYSEIFSKPCCWSLHICIANQPLSPNIDNKAWQKLCDVNNEQHIFVYIFFFFTITSFEPKSGLILLQTKASKSHYLPSLASNRFRFYPLPVNWFLLLDKTPNQQFLQLNSTVDNRMEKVVYCKEKKSGTSVHKA